MASPPAFMLERRRSISSQLRSEAWRTTDRVCAAVMAAQWVVIMAAVCWQIATAQSSFAASRLPLVLVSIGTVAALVAAWRRSGEPGTKYVVTAGQMLVSSVVVHMSGGRMEAHLHAFASLVLLAGYQDWRLLLAATGLAVGGHALSLHGGPVEGLERLWRPAEHAVWILFEDLVLILYCVRGDRAMRDVAEARAEAESHCRRYQAVVEHAGDGIVVFDAQTFRILEHNASFLRCAGISPEQIDRLALMVALSKGSGPAFEAQVAALTPGCHPVTSDRVLCRLDGTTLDVACSLSPTVFEGRRAVCAVIHDIGAHHAMEAELAKARDAAVESARTKAEFLANMSHEIRTPMNGVMGLAGLLLDTKLEPEQREWVETIETSAEALLHIINEILDFSKIDAGRLELEPTSFELRETIEGIADLLAYRAQAKGLELASLVDSEVPPFLKGDAGRLRQVLLNLVGNAVKFTEEGDVCVRVSPHQDLGGEVSLKFEVHDTGIGISEEARARLFQPFTQVDGSASRRYGGTGLGLVISKKLVEMMGGEMGVKSEPGKGSVFWFTARFAKEASSAAANPGADLSRLRALVVDDNEIVRNLLTRRLAGWRIRVQAVGIVDNALACLRAASASADPFNVLLIDSDLKGLDGAAVIRHIREDPAFALLPIVVMAPMGIGLDTWPDGLADSIVRVSKPLKMKALLASLERIAAGTRAAWHPHRPPLRPTAAPGGAMTRVLVAEDNPTNQRVVLAQLRKLGCSALAVSSGTEVLPALEQAPYDLVLMDCQMPEMDGFAATRAVRASHGAAARIPIIAMTANARADDRDRCLDAGMDDYVCKPLKLEALRRLLITWRGGRMGGIRELERLPA